jgi:drug/metabolite transporter (DMT)-like permease
MVLSRRLADIPSLAVVSASLTITAVAYAPLAIVDPPDHIGPKVIWSVLTLAIVCTAAAFLIFFALIAEVGPTRATVITYVNPAVAIALGVAVLGEDLTTGMIIGFPLVLVGSVLATSRSAPVVSTSDEPPLLDEQRAVTPG